MLRAAFTGGVSSTVIPEDYFLGLDARPSVAAADTMDDLTGEPSAGGYQRQRLASAGDFSMNFENGHFTATSPVVAFRSTTATWGPVVNLFLTDRSDASGYLISSAVLDTPLTVGPGEQVTVRIGMRLKDCP